MTAALYVGDLEKGVREEQLFDVFGRIAPVASLRVCRDVAGRSLGYGYVNYYSRYEANRALEALNFSIINGKSIRVMFSNRDPTLRRSGRANLFIKNLVPTIDNKSLHDMFSPFGSILSCKVATDYNGQSKGYGYVQFETEKSASEAINGLNGNFVLGKEIYVGIFIRRQERQLVGGVSNFTNVYVKNLPKEFTDNDLRHEFASFGEITSAIVMRELDNQSKGFGFVNYEKAQSAAEAVEQMNGKTVRGMLLYVGKAQKKREREAELRAKYEEERNGRLENFPGLNLYLKNLEDNINDATLKELFEGFGEIGSCKVMVDAKGRSKGSGFVSFTTVEAGHKAINGMNGKMLGGKPLYVSIFQRKDERRAILTAHFACIYNQGAITPAIQPNVAPNHLYFGQGVPGLVPPQVADYGYQQYPQHFIPGIRPGAPNIMAPYNMQQPGYPIQRAGAWHGPEMHYQHLMMHPNGGQDITYIPNTRDGVNSTAVFPQGFSYPMVTPGFTQMDVSRGTTPFIPTKHLMPSALASADREKKQLNVGKRLYSLVQELQPENAGEVTGVLLKLKRNEVLHLIGSASDLKKKVAEAMEALRKKEVETSASTAPSFSDADPAVAASSSGSADITTAPSSSGA